MRSLLTAEGSFNTGTGAGAPNYSTRRRKHGIWRGVALIQQYDWLDNTAIGAVALLNNTTGSENTATGIEALKDNTTGCRQYRYWFSSAYEQYQRR